MLFKLSIIFINIHKHTLRMHVGVNLVRNNPHNSQQRVVECLKILKYSDLG